MLLLNVFIYMVPQKKWNILAGNVMHALYVALFSVPPCLFCILYIHAYHLYLPGNCDVSSYGAIHNKWVRGQVNANCTNM